LAISTAHASLIHIRAGKGGRDRDVPLTPKLLETLREYWRWMKPKTYLFPGTVKNWRADAPISDKIPWEACRQAAQRAGITKHVSPHTLPLLCHSPARSRHRSACDPDVAGPCQARRHRLVPASFAEAPDLRDQSIEAISFHSCRNRHCPKCQTNARDQWLAERSKELLPVSYVHVVFTLPHELSWLALQNKKVVYDLLFRTSAATLLEMAQDAEAESAT
jgi:hypothetical protein